MRSVKRSICRLFHARNEDVNVEEGEMQSEREEKGPLTRDEAIDNPVKKAANEYCAVLRKVFHDDLLERVIMLDIEMWQDGRYVPLSRVQSGLLNPWIGSKMRKII